MNNDEEEKYEEYPYPQLRQRRILDTDDDEDEYIENETQNEAIIEPPNPRGYRCFKICRSLPVKCIVVGLIGVGVASYHASHWMDENAAQQRELLSGSGQALLVANTGMNVVVRMHDGQLDTHEMPALATVADLMEALGQSETNRIRLFQGGQQLAPLTSLADSGVSAQATLDIRRGDRMDEIGSRRLKEGDILYFDGLRVKHQDKPEISAFMNGRYEVWIVSPELINLEKRDGTDQNCP